MWLTRPANCSADSTGEKINCKKHQLVGDYFNLQTVGYKKQESHDSCLTATQQAWIQNSLRQWVKVMGTMTVCLKLHENLYLYYSSVVT